jgi:hypothetical protein
MPFKFSEFIAEQKNTHMTHIEDKVLYGGVNGTRDAIMALRSLRDMLGGEHSGGSMSIKWDGAPAVFAGLDPRDGKFFVAKKGIFNKNPKVYKTMAEVDADTSGDLAAKLKLALQYLPELGITDVIQGDFLFSSSDLKRETIHGNDYITFHPNTIIYAIPADSRAARDIQSAKIGIVWHTTYVGKSFEDMRASYGVDVSRLKRSRNVWSQDAMLRDLTNYTMSKKETEEVNSLLTEAGKLFNQISGNALRELENNPTLAQHIETFNNSFVRRGEIIQNTRQHVSKLINWIHEKYEKEADKRSTEKGKATQYQKRQELLSFFSTGNKKALERVFELQRVIVLAKLKLINTMNRMKRIDTFVKTKYGFKVTGHEGYVAIDRIGKNAVKIVDRLEFSHNNFNPDILKGWQK